MTPAELLREISSASARGEPVALATVVLVRGSAPRRAGARMLVLADGRTLGSISGGCLEAEAYALAQEALRDGRARTFEYDLTRDVAAGEGMVCGGKVRVLVERIDPGA